MTSTPFQDTAIKKILAGVEEAFIRMRVPLDLNNTTVNIMPDQLAHEVGVSIGIKMAALEVFERVEEDSISESDELVVDTVNVPLNWFEAVKERLMLTRFKNLVISAWGDVKYKQIPIKSTVNKVVRRVHKHFHTCPLPAGSSTGAYISFLMWDTPFDGSRAEWLAMKKVTNALLELPPFEIPNMNVMRAVMDYRAARDYRRRVHSSENFG